MTSPLQHTLRSIAALGLLLSLGMAPAAAQNVCPPDALSGDVNQDGVLTPADALQTFRHFLGVIPPLEACAQELANVDAPQSSPITPADSLCILQEFLDLPSCFDFITVAVVVSKGRVQGADITVFQLNLDGSRGQQIVPDPETDQALLTNAQGVQLVTIPRTAGGPFLVVARGGMYYDEVTGYLVPLGNDTEMLAFLPQGTTRVAVTPLTHALALVMQDALQMADQADIIPNVPQVIEAVLANATTTYGFDPVHTTPADPTNLPAQGTTTVQYAMILGGISQLFANTALGAGEALMAIAADLTDGAVDGRDFNDMDVPNLITDPETTLAAVANTFGSDPPSGITGTNRDRFQMVAEEMPVAIAPPPGGTYVPFILNVSELGGRQRLQ